MPLIDDLYRRAEHACELCKASDDLSPHSIMPDSEELEDRLLLCGVCYPQVSSEEELDARHWFCLQESIWSITPIVQIVSWRLLQTLSKTETWAQDLLDQAYLEEDVLERAKQGVQGGAAGEDDAVVTLDANGTALQEGDSITLVRNLDVKGAGFTAKQGTLVKGIRLTGDPDYIEGRINNITIMLKTKFIKRA